MKFHFGDAANLAPKKREPDSLCSPPTIEKEKLVLKLGQKAKDIISGFSGIVLGRATYLTGCSQILLVPTRLNKDGTRPDSQWFDEPRLQAVGREVIELDLQVSGRYSPGADEPAAPRK